ncbi:PaaI family thioesterase [Yoonia sp. GPGPB17]|uniref:PaaI family thioesterase n=1 Tax=Yoonia sp. GPGPB17 TaxID=3026147 RepID=UPI0030BB27EC
MFTATSPDQMPDLETTLSMSGLEFMQAMRDGTISRPPISALMNYSVEKVEAGEVVFRGTPEFQHTNPAGGVHGGWYGTLLDSCMSCAVMTVTPKGSVYTTLEYKVNMVGAIPLGCEIRAIGTINHAGRTTGVAQGEIRDVVTNKLYATGSATCLIMKLRGD